MSELSFAVIGAGFWSRYQIAAWKEISGARCVAICDREVEKAHALAKEFGIPRVYADPEEMLNRERIDFVDLIVGPESNPSLIGLAAHRRINVICQKLISCGYSVALEVARVCEEAGVLLLVHENFRWQTPIRRVKELLNSGAIGTPFRSHLQFSHGNLTFFDKQPYLYGQNHFALFDMGPHLLDLSRFYFGEPLSLSAREIHIHPAFLGADIVSVMLHFPQLVCHCELSWRTTPYDVYIEGNEGSIMLAGDEIQLERGGSKSRETMLASHYDWSDPTYGFAHPSIVSTNWNLLQAIQGATLAEASVDHNLRTIWLLHLVLLSMEANQSQEVSPRLTNVESIGARVRR